jgi:flagellar basal body P-ring protein FlgI
VISGEVEISPVVVVVDNVTVSAGNQSGIYAVDPAQQATTNLQQLVQALEAVQVSAETRIRVIRELEKSGKLHAWVIYE